MSAHVAIFARLSTFAPLTALVGTRIYPDVVPDTPVWPAITYSIATSTPDHGALTDPNLCRATVMISVRSRTQLEALDITDQVRAALDRYRQVTLQGVRVDDCFFESVVDMFEFESRIYHQALSFRLHYRS